MIRLSDATLIDLPESVERPNYDRTSLKPGIVHIGLGNFHRAHQAWYLHRLFQAGLDRDWAIVGAGVRPYDAKQREKFLEQDCLSTLIELAPNGVSAEVIGSMIDYASVEDGFAALINRMADPAIRIVSLTVTEGGYFIDPATKTFDADHTEVRHDINNIDHPITAFGAIVSALNIRRNRGVGPFTCLSCDNLQGNGSILRKTVTSLANEADSSLAEWIDRNCTFPNSMVDCIVPTTGPKELALVHELGIDDRVPVTHENFRQWVIEDKFCAGHPDWSRVGVTFTDKVHNYETMKLRMLNAGHQLLANPGEVLSIDNIKDCMAHPLIRRFFHKVQHEEIMPHVRAVPEFTPEAYFQLLVRRFSHPLIVDTTRRVSYDGSSRHPGFILPIVRDGLNSGASVEGLALAEALWARMCEGTREDSSCIEPNDPCWDTLQKVAKTAKNRPRAWLEQRQYYGDLIESTRFVSAFERWLAQIWSEGCEATLDFYSSAEVSN